MTLSGGRRAAVRWGRARRSWVGGARRLVPAAPEGAVAVAPERRVGARRAGACGRASDAGSRERLYVERVSAGKPEWGGRDSNPRPRDYESPALTR